MSWNGGGFGTTTIYFGPMQVPRCGCGCMEPDAIVMKRAPLVALLEEVRKLTHPDVNGSEKANEVTAKVNACLTEITKPK